MKSPRLLFLCLICATTSFGQFNMPAFKDVVTSFFSTYQFKSDDSYLKFQRKKDGWYISEDKYTNPGNYFNTALYWSAQTKSYKKLNNPLTASNDSQIAETVDNYLTLINWNYEEYQFQRNKYYGYPGWDWDVINDEADPVTLTDSLLEARARANSNYASGFIAEQFGDLFVNNDVDRLALKANSPISSSRIDKFIYYETKALDAYEKLKQLNPGYETRVGNISVKLANEYMFSYLELLMAGDTTRAIGFANKAKYPDSLLALSRSYLAGLPENSILITGGDNDTYPLWYLQKIKHYRNDVSVLNYSLIGFRRYLSFIGKDKKQPLFNVKDSSYLKDDFDYFLFGNKTGEGTSLDVNTFLLHLAGNYNPYDSPSFSYKDVTIKQYYTKHLFFNTPDKKKSGPFEIGNSMLMNDYLLLDIINSSGKRKVYFSFNIELVSALLIQKDNLYTLDFTGEK